MTYDEQETAVRAALAAAPHGEFSLRGFPGDRFRVLPWPGYNTGSHFYSAPDGGPQIVIEIRQKAGRWQQFGRFSLHQLLAEVRRP